MLTIFFLPGEALDPDALQQFLRRLIVRILRHQLAPMIRTPRPFICSKQPADLTFRKKTMQQLAAQQPQTSDELYDVLTARDLLDSRAELLRSLERQGVLVVDTVPDKLTIDAVNRYLALKTGVRM